MPSFAITNVQICVSAFEFVVTFKKIFMHANSTTVTIALMNATTIGLLERKTNFPFRVFEIFLKEITFVILKIL